MIRSPPPAPLTPAGLPVGSLTRGYRRRSAVKRYLRHVLPKGLHSVRYHGFHHPTAKKTLHKMQLYSGQSPVRATTTKNKEPSTKNNLPKCPCCQQPMKRIGTLLPAWMRKVTIMDLLLNARAPPPR